MIRSEVLSFIAGALALASRDGNLIGLAGMPVLREARR
jgi:hypothetical protein